MENDHLKALLARSPEKPFTQEELEPLTDEMTAICQRIAAEVGAFAVALVVTSQPDAQGHAHVIDAATVDFMPLSLFYGTIAGGHAQHEARVKHRDHVLESAARRNGIN